MKRFFLILFSLSVAAFPAFSQLGVFTQRGRATQEMTTAGFSAAHNNIPLNSKVKVTNTFSGKEIEVSITGRILMSSLRIIDLSLEAWNALGLSEDTVVMLTYTPVIPAVEPAPDIAAITADATAQAAAAQAASVIAAAQAEAKAQAEAIINAARHEADALLSKARAESEALLSAAHSDAQAQAQTEAVLSAARTEANSILNAARSEAARGASLLEAARIAAQSETARAAAAKEEADRAAAQAAAAREELARLAAQTNLAHSAPPLSSRVPRSSFPVDISEFDEEFFEWLIALIVKPDAIKVIPSMPASDTAAVYRLHVGSFKQIKNADRAEKLLNAMGLSAGRESFNDFIRVYVVNVSSENVPFIIQKLGIVGFRTIWIRED